MKKFTILLISIFLVVSCGKKDDIVSGDTNNNEEIIVENETLNSEDSVFNPDLVEEETKNELIGIMHSNLTKVYEDNVLNLNDYALVYNTCSDLLGMTNEVESNLLDFQKEVYNKYVNDCEKLRKESKIRYYSEVINQNPELVFPIPDFEREFELYNLRLNETYEDFINNYEISISEEEFNEYKSEYKVYNSLEEFEKEARDNIMKQRAELVEKQREYRIYLQQNN